MSKMADIALQLDERAVELGFADHLEALGNGYEWGIKDNGEAFLFNPKEEQEKAHEAWLKERDRVLEILDLVADVLDEINDGLVKTGDEELVEAWSLMELSRETRGVANFIKEQCHD